MDSFQLNKIAGAVLGTLTVLLGVNAISEGLFHHKKPEKPGFEVAEGKKEGGEAAGGAGGGGVAALLASADPAKGEQAAKKCGACHSFGKGEPAKLGPNLYGVIGLPHAHMEGFAYSDAMKKTHDTKWDFANIDKWLEDPKAYIPGNKMAFAGVKDPKERANIIAYLNKNSEKPLDLPKGGDKPAAGGGDKPAAGGAPAGGGDDAFVAKVAAADPAKGESVSKRCAACHSFKKDEPAKVGPNLYGIVGLPHAHMEGFGYSDAMKKTHDKVWDVANLSHWLEDPKAYIPGNKMAFAGVKNEDERASLIAYLNKNSDKPVDLKAAGGGDKKPEGDKKTEAAPAPAKPEEKKAEAPAAAPAPAAPPAEEKKAEAPAPAPAGGEEKKAEAPAAAPAAPAGGDKPAAAPAAGGEVTKLLASADPASGEKIVEEQCAACHTVKKGEPAGAGPNLYGIVGAKHAHQDGFEYSDAFKGHQQGPWDFALLDQWLTDPAKVVPGTMMAFPGLPDPKQRADVIAFLNKNSDKPVDLPK